MGTDSCRKQELLTPSPLFIFKHLARLISQILIIPKAARPHLLHRKKRKLLPTEYYLSDCHGFSVLAE